MPTPDLTQTPNPVPPFHPSPLSQAAQTTPRIDPMPLASALAALDPAKDSDWTVGGKPDIAAVSALVGVTVTRAEIDAVAPDLKRPSTEKIQAPGHAPDDPILSAHRRLNLLEEDIAFLRAKLGWPTKDRT